MALFLQLHPVSHSYSCHVHTWELLSTTTVYYSTWTVGDWVLGSRAPWQYLLRKVRILLSHLAVGILISASWNCRQGPLVTCLEKNKQLTNPNSSHQPIGVQQTLHSVFLHRLEWSFSRCWGVFSRLNHCFLNIHSETSCLGFMQQKYTVFQETE